MHFHSLSDLIQSHDFLYWQGLILYSVQFLHWVHSVFVLFCFIFFWATKENLVYNEKVYIFFIFKQIICVNATFFDVTIIKHFCLLDYMAVGQCACLCLFIFQENSFFRLYVYQHKMVCIKFYPNHYQSGYCENSPFKY